jgi:drug/metabolite transporter (DMT)-like permease
MVWRSYLVDMTTMHAQRTEHASRSGITLALASSVGFALQAIWGMYAYQAGLNAVTLLSLRFIVASLVFAAIVAIRRPAWPGWRLAGFALGLGLVPFAIESCSFFMALNHIDAGFAELLFYVYPAIVVAFGALTRRSPVNRRRAGALAVASAGIALVLLGGASVHPDPVGIALALVAAVGYSVFVLATEGVLGRIDPFLFAGLLFTGAGISLTGFGAATGQLHLDVSAAGWLQVGLLATVSTVGAETAFLVALHRVGSGTASILSSFEPLVAAALAWILFGQALGPIQIVGGALVLAAIVLLAPRRTTVPDHVAPAPAADPAPARPLAHEPAFREHVGVRTQVGRLSRDRVRGRRRGVPPVAKR